MPYISRLLAMSGSPGTAPAAPSRREGGSTVPVLEVDEVREVLSPRPSPEPPRVAAPEVGAARPSGSTGRAVDLQTEGAPLEPQRFELPVEGVRSADDPRPGGDSLLEPVFEEPASTDEWSQEERQPPPPRPDFVEPPPLDAADHPDESEPPPAPPAEGPLESTDDPPAEVDGIGRFREALDTVRRWMVQSDPDAPEGPDLTDSAYRPAAETALQSPQRRRMREPSENDRDWSTPPVEQTVEISIGAIDVIVEKPATATPARPLAPAPAAGADNGTAPPFKPARHFIRS